MGSQSYMAGSNFRKQNVNPHTRIANSNQISHIKGVGTTFASQSSTVTPQTSVASRTDHSLIDRPERMDPIDLELSRIDNFRESSEFSHPTGSRRMRGDDFV